MASIVIPDPPKKPEFANLPLREKLKLLDLLGAIVGITALVLFNFAWNQAPIVGWEKAYVYVTMIIGILLIPAFLYIEFRVAKSPLVPFESLTVDVGFVLACIACGWASFGKHQARRIRGASGELTHQQEFGSFTLSTSYKFSEAYRLCSPWQ